MRLSAVLWRRRLARHALLHKPTPPNCVIMLPAATARYVAARRATEPGAAVEPEREEKSNAAGKRGERQSGAVGDRESAAADRSGLHPRDHPRPQLGARAGARRARRDGASRRYRRARDAGSRFRRRYARAADL